MQDYAMYLSNNTTNLAVNISNSIMAGETSDADFGIVQWDLSGDASGSLALDNCDIHGQEIPLIINASGTGSLTTTIKNSSFLGGDSEGIYINQTGTGAQIFTMSGSSIVADTTCLLVGHSGSLTATVTDSSFVSSDDGCLEFDSNGPDATIVLSGNYMTADENYTLYFAQTAGNVTVTCTDNAIYNTYDESAIFTQMSGSAVSHTATFKDNIVQSYLDSWLVSQTAGNLTATWTDNSITSDGTCINLTQSAGTSNLTFNGNTLTALGTAGISIVTNGSASECLLTANNNNVQAQAQGVLITQTAGNSTISLSSNTVASAGDAAIELDQNIANATLTLTNNTLSSQYEGEAIYWNVTGSANNTTVTVTDNDLYSEYGIYGIQHAGTLNASIDDNYIAGYYVTYFDLSNTDATLSLTNNDCEGDSPVYIGQTAGTLTATVTGNTLIAGDGYSFEYEPSASANALLSLSGNTMSAGSADVVYLDFADIGTINTTIINNRIIAPVNDYAINSTLSSGTETLTVTDNLVTNGGGFNLVTTGASLADATWLVNGNSFVALSEAAVTATHGNSNVSSSVCMQLNNNTTYPTSGAYVVTNSEATPSFVLNSPEGNIGQLTTTNVTIGSCR